MYTQMGLGSDEVRLSEPERQVRQLLIMFIAYFLLSAFGAIAEVKGVAETVMENMVRLRVLSLETVGFLILASLHC